MSEQVTDAVQQPSYLGMSDAEIMNASEPMMAPVQEPEEVEEESVDTPETPDVEDVEDAPATAADTDDDDTGTVAEEEVDAPQKKQNEVEDPKEPSVEKKEVSEDLDYKAEYERLLTPFKANGRDINIKNVDDAIALMQMGANYNKKMAALKPNLKLMKMLENNGLLDEGKISYLIDLERKDPDAINKLVKDSGIDPMDLDAEKAGAYKQSTYTVDDREMELDTVLDELQSTPTYTRTLDIVSTKWDGASKQVIAGSPQLLKVINDHVSSGIYDMINAEVNSERVFGRLNGLSDIEAYRQVGDAIQARGGFNHLNQGSSQAQGQSVKPVVVAPKPRMVDDSKLNDKRRAASSTKPTAPKTDNKDFNPLALSDAEFTKLVNKQLL